jgi:hypothetical protein
MGRASVRLSFAVGVLLALVFAMISPLIGVPGPESALVLGVVLTPFVAAAGARIAIAARTQTISRTGELLERALAVGIGAVALPTFILALNGARVPWCAPWEGLAFMALGPLAGAVLAAMVGVAVGTIVRGPRIATALAAALPILVTLASFGLLYFTPAIFAYGHFFGYYPGTLYDPDVAIEAPYLTFRAFSAVQIGAVAAWILAVVDPQTARASFQRAAQHRGTLAVTAALFAMAFVGEMRATDLRHRSTASSIAEHLGTTLHGQYCDAVVPRELPRERGLRLRDDCDLRVAQMSDALGVRPPERVTAFFFRSTGEKRELMGASHTYIAKPWRREVYLQIDAWPHPVLAHEIVHVVAGEVGIGPFKISGSIGGWLPSPGIIEGIAVALAWEERDGLTPHQWARAMMELERMPSLASTEGLGFLLQPASRAYVASGSFMRWILDTRGPEVVREIYRRGDYEGPLETSLSSAEVEWRAWLEREVPLPPEALAMAEARFDRPAIFSQVCPHAVAALMEEVSGDIAAGDDAHAAQTCERVLDIDPNDTRARAWYAVSLARQGDIERARRELDRLIGPPSAARPVIRAARQGIADALWSHGHLHEAATIYRAILEEPLGDEEARQIEVRLLAVESGVVESTQLRQLFAPPREMQSDGVTAMQAIGRLRELRADGLGSYLEARQMMHRERFDLAMAALTEMEERGLPNERMRREARRMRATAMFGLGERAQSRELWREVFHDAHSTEAARVEALDWLDRIERAGPLPDVEDRDVTEVPNPRPLPIPTPTPPPVAG